MRHQTRQRVEAHSPVYFLRRVLQKESAANCGWTGFGRQGRRVLEALCEFGRRVSCQPPGPERFPGSTVRAGPERINSCSGGSA